jgi:hypothetical protein
LHNGINALKEKYLKEDPTSAVCVQRSIDSRNSAIHNAYRILLRPSSFPEPRDPSLNVVKKNNILAVTENGVKPKKNGADPRCHGRYQRQGGQRRTGHPVANPTVRLVVVKIYRVNDPSAGSPTETLLRLLLPLSDKVHKTSRSTFWKPDRVSVRIIHRITQSVGATGGVYKGQGRNQHELMTRAY